MDAAFRTALLRMRTEISVDIADGRMEKDADLKGYTKAHLDQIFGECILDADCELDLHSSEYKAGRAKLEKELKQDFLELKAATAEAEEAARTQRKHDVRAAYKEAAQKAFPFAVEKAYTENVTDGNREHVRFYGWANKPAEDGGRPRVDVDKQEDLFAILLQYMKFGPHGCALDLDRRFHKRWALRMDNALKKRAHEEDLAMRMAQEREIAQAALEHESNNRPKKKAKKAQE